MFRGRIELPHETSTCGEWAGLGNNPINTLLEGVAVGMCPCQLPAEDHFTLNLARHPGDKTLVLLELLWDQCVD